MNAMPRFLLLFAAILTTSFASAQDKRQAILDATLVPYTGPSEKGVDVSTLTGKVMSGYQGWFTAENDGLGRGFYHWGSKKGFEEGKARVDMWPDLTELDADERHATPLKHADGRAAELFTSQNPKTVERHFRWMKEAGIDGVFVQRFAVETFHDTGLKQFNTVLGHCRAGANKHGRAYAVMYDLSGLKKGQMQRVIDDWRGLVEKMKITQDPAYLRHNGKPVISVWGVGFSDNRDYTLDECLALIEFLKKDSAAGPCTVIIGVPTFWRILKRDAVEDPKLHEVIKAADIVSPWSVGRFGNPKGVEKYYAETAKGDLEWCKTNGKEFFPVVFPGFSWHNMNPKSPQNSIPRLGGQFLWKQLVEAKKTGATMVYQAMFDEVDEGTAIFKVTNDPPAAPTFVTYEGLPSDFYLKLVGNGGRLIRGEIEATEALPK